MQYLGALAAQFLHACSDHRKIVGGAGSGALAAQLLHTRSDHCKIVGGAGSGHVSSLYHCEVRRRAVDYTIRLVSFRRCRREVDDRFAPCPARRSFQSARNASLCAHVLQRKSPSFSTSQSHSIILDFCNARRAGAGRMALLHASPARAVSVSSGCPLRQGCPGKVDGSSWRRFAPNFPPKAPCWGLSRASTP